MVQRPEPTCLQVTADIRNQVLSGRLREGDRVPSAREITREWGVALATAPRVLAAPRSEGLVRTAQGVGTDRDGEGVIEDGGSVTVAGRWTSYEDEIGDE